jgi:nucleotidyltransferase substrate binding protein (TIGR01987 family)
MKQAYADGLLEDEHGWLELLNARNLTSHIYDEATAKEIFQSIRDTYCPILQKLVATLEQ